MNNRIPRVGLVTVSRSLSGAEKRFVRIFVAANEHGLASSLIVNSTLCRLILACRDFSDRLSTDTALSSAVFAMPDLPLADDVFVWKSMRRAQLAAKIMSVSYRQQLDGFHVAGTHAIAALLVRMGYRVILEITSPDNAGRLARYRGSHWINRLCALVPVSTTVHEALKATGVLDTHPAVTIVPAPNVFTGGVESVLRSPRANKQKVIAYAARFIPRKNPVLFAHAAARFLDDHPEWSVVMLGRGPEEAAVRHELSRHLGRRATVEHVPSIVPVLRESKIFVSMIEADNFPSQSVVEAMACGNALLLSNRGDSWRFTQCDNGRLTGLTSCDIVESLKAMIAQDCSLEQMGERSKSCLMQHFGSSIYIEHLKKLYALL